MQCEHCDEVIEKEECNCAMSRQLRDGELLRTPARFEVDEGHWESSGVVTQPVFYE